MPSQSEFDFIKSLFIDLNEKVENLQTKEDAKSTEERVISEIKTLKALTDEHQKVLAEHKGHFNTIKIFTTTGIASLIAFYSWVVSIIDSHK